MVEAFGIACHEMVSLDFRCGSPSDLPSLAQNVGSWGTSGSEIRVAGGPFVANSSHFASTMFSRVQAYQNLYPKGLFYVQIDCENRLHHRGKPKSVRIGTRGKF